MSYPSGNEKASRMKRSGFVGFVCIAMLVWSSNLNAQSQAQVRHDVSQGVSNMRSGPGQYNSLIVAVPAGSTLML